MLQRMLIDKMENRILVGITAFLGVMVLVGWVAINENARMASFERQFEARAIERGAEKFAANCATCHGEEGHGIVGRAPGLNSPHFFGYDYFADIDNELSLLDAQEVSLNAERQELAEELAAEGLSDARREDIQNEILDITDQINGEGGISAQRAALQEQRMQIAQQLQPAAQAGYPIQITDEGVEVISSRLSQLQWGGTLEQFITTTLIHGRPTSISYWGGNQMVAWSQRAGGPLRDDQIGDLATYILNWDKGNDWTIEDALVVNQYPIVPGVGGAEATDGAEAAGVDVAAIITQIEENSIVGDATRGEALYTNQQSSQLGRLLACSGCHLNAVNGPAFAGTWDRVINERLTLPQFEGYTPEQYIIESIVATGDYVVSGWPSGVMPANFGEGVSVQDLADLVAYLETTASQ